MIQRISSPPPPPVLIFASPETPISDIYKCPNIFRGYIQVFTVATMQQAMNAEALTIKLKWEHYTNYKMASTAWKF